MNKTKIDWCDYSWNPITGCLRRCGYCYAHRIAKRFGRSFEPQFHPDRLLEPERIRKPSVIFPVSMGDLFGEGVKEEWTRAVLGEIARCQQHRFVLVTKCWRNMSFFAGAIPTNAIAMATVTTDAEAISACSELGQGDFRQVKVGYNVEPIREAIGQEFCCSDWIIVGCQTGPGAPPQNQRAVRTVVERCRRAGTPVFVKENTGLDGPREWPIGWEDFSIVAENKKLSTL